MWLCGIVLQPNTETDASTATVLKLQQHSQFHRTIIACAGGVRGVHSL